MLFLSLFKLRPIGQREPWLWALSLSAVSPLAMLSQRKIWAQSMLPIFCALFLIGWLRRNRYSGACLWGFIGAILGQIHMSGFFFAAGFFFCDIALGPLSCQPTKNEVASVVRRLPGWGVAAHCLVTLRLFDVGPLACELAGKCSEATVLLALVFRLARLGPKLLAPGPISRFS